MHGGQIYNRSIIVEYIQPFVLVGTHTWSSSPVVFAPRRPPEQRAELPSRRHDPLLDLGQVQQPVAAGTCPVFNLIEQGGDNRRNNPLERKGDWTLVSKDGGTAQKHARDTMTGRRSVEAVVRGGEKPHAAPLEHTDKLAGEILFNIKKEDKEDAL